MANELNNPLVLDDHETYYNGKIVDSPYWNIFLLALAWALTLTTSTLLTSIGPLTATEELDASGELMILLLY